MVGLFIAILSGICMSVQGVFNTEVTKQSALVKAVDEVNRKNGHDTIRMAVQGYGENWKLRNEYVSKQYTTNIRDIIIAKAK